MPLPIIIILERHWDCSPKHFLMAAFPDFAKLGYDTLTQEFPAAQSLSDLEKNIDAHQVNTKETIDFTLRRLHQMNIKLDKPLWDLDYALLDKYLHLYVSTKAHAMFAVEIRGYPSLLANKTLWKQAENNNISVVGVDIESEKFNALYTSDLRESEQNLSATMPQRDLAIGSNLEKRYAESNGIILVVGHSHFKGVYAYLQKQSLASACLIYGMHNTVLNLPGLSIPQEFPKHDAVKLV